MELKRIGIIGVGLMGKGIATNIQKAGYPLTFLNHPGNQTVDGLIASGAKSVETAADVAKNSDVVVICVTGSPQVEAVLTGAEGVLSAVHAGKTVVDCSTAVPSVTMRLARLVEDTGAHFLDAPMTRTPKEAAEGRLNLIVGGAKDVFEETLALFETFAENITYAGQAGSGHSLKLLHNFVSLGFSAILAEASAASNKAGIEPSVFFEVLSKGGGNSVILDRFSPYILEQDPSGFRFSLANGNKDIGYYSQMVADLEASSTVLGGVSSLFEGLVDDGHADRFIPEIVSLIS